MLASLHPEFLEHKGLFTKYGEGWGGGYKMGGGHVKFYPYKREGAENLLAMLKEGGHKEFPGSFYTVLGGGGAKCFHSLKGVHKKFHPVLRGGGRKKFWTRDFPIL